MSIMIVHLPLHGGMDISRFNNYSVLNNE